MQAWNWKKYQTDNFLKILENADMITRETRTGQTIITVCNYDTYQLTPKNIGQLSDSKADKKRTELGQLSDKCNKGTNNLINNDIIKDITLVTCDFSFDEFYEAYPIKKSKADAAKKFRKVCKDKKSFDEIMLGLTEFKRWIVETKQHPKYVKHPSTWLNQECWKDELIFAKPPPEPKKQSSNLDGIDKYINGYDTTPDFDNMKDISQ
jgi:hypothetical protein